VQLRIRERVAHERFNGCGLSGLPVMRVELLPSDLLPNVSRGERFVDLHHLG
jgi:hypothetical protein